MDLKTKIKNRDDFSLKFNDAPFNTNGILNPGWAEPTYDDFFLRMVDEPVLLNQSTVVPMANLQHDLDMLVPSLDFEAQRDTATGCSTPLTTTELNPGMNRKQLIAQPLQARVNITDNFLEENIEKEEFLTTYINQLADEMGPAFERWGIFADMGSSATAPSGFKMTNGLLSQLKQVSSDNNNEANGLANLVFKDNVGNGILDAMEMYVDQDGNISNATCVLPPQIYAKLMVEIARDKNTDLGDAVFQDGNMTKILGIEIVADDILRETRNGYDRMQFTDGVYKGNGTYVDKMKYGFIGQPSNVVFGMMREFDIKNQWDIDVLGYKVALLCKGDAKILWDQDTLAIPFTMNNSA